MRSAASTSPLALAERLLSCRGSGVAEPLLPYEPSPEPRPEPGPEWPDEPWPLFGSEPWPEPPWLELRVLVATPEPPPESLPPQGDSPPDGGHGMQMGSMRTVMSEHPRMYSTHI